MPEVAYRGLCTGLYVNKFIGRSNERILVSMAARKSREIVRHVSYSGSNNILVILFVVHRVIVIVANPSRMTAY